MDPSAPANQHANARTVCPEFLRRFERDVLEALEQLAPRARLRDVEAVSGWTLQGRMRRLYAAGTVARSGYKGRGITWWLTERGKIALAIARGIEQKRRATFKSRTAVARES